FRHAAGVLRAAGVGLALLTCAMVGSARTLSTHALQPSAAHSAASGTLSPHMFIAPLLNNASPGGESPTDGATATVGTSPTSPPTPTTQPPANPQAGQLTLIGSAAG